MKEKITLYKQMDKNGNTYIFITELAHLTTVAQKEIEVDFPEFDKEEVQKIAIKNAISEAKARHKKELDELTRGF